MKDASNCERAYYNRNGTRNDLCFVKEWAMDSFLTKAKTKKITGLSVYIDRRGRLWPSPETTVNVLYE